MPKIHSSPTPPPTSLPPVKPNATAPKGMPPVQPQLPGDKLNIKGLPHSKQSPAGEIKLFDAAPEKDKKPWGIKSAHVNFGYVLDNDVFHTGPMRIRNEADNTDLTISGYEQIDRKSWDYITLKDGQRFSPDEPQFNLGVNMTFNNNFGVELDTKHNKIIMDGYDQEVHVKGKLHGQEVDGMMPLNSVIQQHEQTLGNMEISALATYTIDLPAPGNHRFSFISKAGPNIITSNTRFRSTDANGESNGGTTKLAVVGYGAMVENGLRYQFGPKVGQLGIELNHSLSYLNYSNYNTTNGHSVSHSAAYNTVSLKATVGIHGNKQKPQPFKF